MKNAVIIVAGGSGSRMKQSLPKQFLLLAGKPVLMHTISCFHAYDDGLRLILVLPPGYIDYWRKLCEEYGFTVQHEITTGGETRFHTVKSGLSLLQQEELVAIHDGVRPLVSKATLDRCFITARDKGSAIPCIPIPESIRIQKEGGSFPADRELYRLIQTPQVFRKEILTAAYALEYHPEFTDDAGVVEKAGFPVVLVDGNRENIKITTPEDLIIAEVLMKGPSPALPQGEGERKL